MGKVGIIIQARMGSTRFPGKVLKKIDDKNTVLELLLKRMKLCKSIDEIIIATTPDEKNSLIIDLAKKHDVSYFIGSETNVLERFYEAAKHFNLDIIVRITADCPFVDPKILDNMINFYVNNKYEYVMNLDWNSNFPPGFDTEIFSFKVLEKIFNLAKNSDEKEHVTLFIKKHPYMFLIFSYNLKNLKKYKDLRLTIDEKEDLSMCREIFKKLKENGKFLNFSIFDILEIIENNPEIVKINKHLIK